MKGYFLFSTLLALAPSNCMEKPATGNDINKKELLALIKAHDASNILNALQHRKAAQTIDNEILKQAEKEHKEYMKNKQLHESVKLSKTWSIVVMLTKAIPDKTQKKEKSSSKRSGKSHSHIVRVSRSEYIDSPKLRLLQLIKNSDLENLRQFIHSGGDRFITEKMLSLAKDKADGREKSSLKEIQIVELLHAHAPKEIKSQMRLAIPLNLN
ncbi:MAG: hypothetical protein AMXMBFR12_07800 [Candidatus Babeliales bacterium]